MENLEFAIYVEYVDRNDIEKVFLTRRITNEQARKLRGDKRFFTEQREDIGNFLRITCFLDND